MPGPGGSGPGESARGRVCLVPGYYDYSITTECKSLILPKHLNRLKS